MEFLHIHQLLGGGLRSPSAFLVSFCFLIKSYKDCLNYFAVSGLAIYVQVNTQQQAGVLFFIFNF